MLWLFNCGAGTQTRIDKNTVLADLYRAFTTVRREIWTQASEVPGLKEHGQILHEQIAEAIAQSDATRAQQLLEQLLGSSTRRIQQVVQGEEPGALPDQEKENPS